MRSSRHQRGYLLITVVVMLFLLATVAIMLTHGSAISARSASSELEATRADYVTEAAMQHALWRSANNSCMGDITIPATTLGSDSYTANATGAVAGTFYTLSADQDAWIRDDQPTTNKGGDSSLHIKDSQVEQPLYRFDLSSLPAGSQINSAVASFYVSGEHPEGPVTVHRITSAWNEGDVTWDSFNSSYDNSVLATIPAQPNNSVRVQVNLTGQVQAWVNGAPNNGILLASTAPGIHAQYASREDGGNAPWLEVVVGSGAASPVTVKATGTLADGNTRSLTRLAHPTLQPPGTYTFQPDAAEGIDAYIWEAEKTTNKGTDDETWVSRTSNNASLSLLKFNIGAIPAHSKIRSATLSLHNRSGNNSNVPVTAHRITNPWDEDFVTWNDRESGTPWNTAGGDIGPNVFATTSVGPTRSVRYEWDLTSLVQGWTDGAYANYGVALATAMASSVGERFDTSDHADPTRRPILTIEYACECGSACMVPQGSGNVLMPVTSTSNPTPGELYRIAMLESWGYVVDTTWEKNSQSNFDSNIANNDVVYVPATVDPANIGTKLNDASIGVATEHVGLIGELGIATNGDSPVAHTLDIVDTSHYITRVFPAGSLLFKTVDTALAATGGTKSIDAQVLATAGSQDSLVTLETGGISTKGGTVTARRVLVPVGNHDLSWDHLSNNGQLIVQRALTWAMNADGGSSGNLLLVVGNASSPASKDSDRKSLFETWGYDVTLIDDDADPDKYKIEVLATDLTYVSGTAFGDAALGALLTGSGNPIVNESWSLVSDFGFADPEGGSGTHHTLSTNPVHYITQPFGGSDATIFESGVLMNWFAGAVSEDLVSQDMAHVGLDSGVLTTLATLDFGDRAWDETLVTNRRAQVPFQEADISDLTADGLSILRRSIEWAAGACSPTTSVLFVVGDANSLSSRESGLKAQIEEWCYGVVLIDDGDSQANFDAAAAASDVIYVSDSISDGDLGNKLTDTRVGIVTESGAKLDDFGFTGNPMATVTYNQYTATDASHYITESFGGGATILFTENLAMPLFSGLPAAGLHGVGSIGTLTWALPTLEIGAERWGGAESAGRRAHLPFGAADMNQLTTIGKTLLRRSINWAAGAAYYGPVAHWRLDETNGTTALDSVGGHDGTLENMDPSTDWVPGQLKGALDFDGSNDLVSVPHQAIFTQVPMTVSAWFKLNTLPTTRSEHGTIIDKRHTADPYASWTLYV
ncbi:MAG: DNRLRE domain-containing protein, partial [Woeseiaceae bacterium]